MSHALIIGDNMVVSRAIENRLCDHGFHSCDRAWVTKQAVDLATRHTPDLIVVCDSVADGSPLEVANQIASSSNAPVLVVASGRVHLERHLPSRIQVQGSFHIVQLDAALATVGTNARELPLCA